MATQYHHNGSDPAPGQVPVAVSAASRTMATPSRPSFPIGQEPEHKTIEVWLE
jgi:hypothetical protein